MSSRRSIVVSLAFGLVLGGCAAGGAGSPDVSAGPSVAVTIVNYGFEPDELPVAAGATVIWTNTVDTPHNVHWLDGKGGAGPNLARGATYVRAFDDPGTYAYMCDLHPLMTGAIKVTE